MAIFKRSTGFVNAFMQDDVRAAEKMYGKANFELYKANYGWDTLLSVNFPIKNTLYVKQVMILLH